MEDFCDARLLLELNRRALRTSCMVYNYTNYIPFEIRHRGFGERRIFFAADVITDRQTAFDSKLLNRDVGSGVSVALYHDLSNKFGTKLRSDVC